MNDIKRRALTGFVVAVALGLSGSAFALKAGCDAPPCGGGGGNVPPPEETAAQNLSVPTIMVGTAPAGLTCGTVAAPSALVPPTGTPLTGFEIDPTAYYWVQKVHTWQAQCFNDTAATAYGAWGDNLEGDAKLKVGKPIRVELVLWNSTSYAGLTTLEGYKVIKLEPSKLDRLSAYGHLAGGSAGSWTDIPYNFPQLRTTDADGDVVGWLVHDSQITFRVCKLVDGLETTECPVPAGTNPTAEINATGKVVYGYNLRVSNAGEYRITFTTSTNVTFTDVDAGGLADAHDAWIDINVVAGGSSKGGGAQ